MVKRSLEKKCEKVVSGRRSKTPRESSKETKFTKTQKSTRRKLNSSRSKTPNNGDSTTDRMQSSDKGFKESEFRERDTPRTSVDEDKENREKIIESRYRRDITDSTSQETVERVIVTAMVHKDQAPDTPKSMLETSKEVTFDDRLRTEIIETEELSRDAVSSAKEDDIVQHTAASGSNLVTKAASLKKDVEGMRQQITQEKTQRKSGRKKSEEGEEEGQYRKDRRESISGKIEKSDGSKEDSRTDASEQEKSSVEEKGKDKELDADEIGKTLNRIVAFVRCTKNVYNLFLNILG